MRLGINISYRDAEGRPLDAQGIAQRAAMIEEAGFDAIWQPDTLARESQPRPDPIVWLSVAAAATSKVTLGTAVYIMPFRNPVELAQRVLSVQLISRGRFVLGVGAGSNSAALASAGVPFEARFRELYKRTATVRALARGEEAEGAFLDPWPETGGSVPLMLGAWHSEISLKRAVNEFDGWICSAGRTSFTVMKDAITRYRDLGGTRAMVATCPVDLTAPYEPFDPDGPFHLRCPPEEAAERLQRLVELGFDDVSMQKADVSSSAKRWEVDVTAEQLAEIRALLPKAGASG